MEVVANGVETEEQWKVIQQSGCDQLQGYVISAPLPPPEFERMAANFCGCPSGSRVFSSETVMSV
jgi:EAL domain-containing protein (putative c-di-GMP-specific phosphodiesterase class I)